MANKNKGIVDIDLGGAMRQVKFDFNTICAVEEFFGKPINDLFGEGGIGMSVLRGSLWIGLQRYHPGIPLEDVGSWLGASVKDGSFQEIAEQLGEAVGLALAGPGGTEDDEPGNVEPPKAGAKKKKKGSTTKRS